MRNISCDFKWKWHIPHASHQKVSWKPSSRPSGKVSMLHARIKPLRRNSGERCSRRQRTSSTDALCIQVLTTSGKLYLSHRMVFLLVSIFRHLNQNLRKGSTQDIFWEVRSSKRILEMLDEILRAKFITTKQMVPNQRKCSSWRSTVVLEVDPNHKRSKWKLARVVATYPGNDGLVRKARIKTQNSEYDRPIHKLCLIATKDELNADRLS